MNGNQPNRGLSIDTRGTPIATAFPINPTAAGVGITQNGTLLGGTTGATAAAAGPGLPGHDDASPTAASTCSTCRAARAATRSTAACAYDELLWNIPGARFACAYDTGRAAVLQQPIETLTYYGRGTLQLGAHELFAEVTGSDADSAKRFSENQYTGNNTTLPIAYPLNALTAATYNDVYDRIAAVFPAIGAVGDRTVDAVGNYGKPIAFRYRCIACGAREYTTNTKTFRAAVGAEGPLVRRASTIASARPTRSSESSSLLGTGYQYRGVFTSGGAGDRIGHRGRGDRPGRPARADRAGRDRAGHRRAVQQRHPQPVLADPDAAGARRAAGGVGARRDAVRRQV